MISFFSSLCINLILESTKNLLQILLKGKRIDLLPKLELVLCVLLYILICFK